MDTEFYDSVKSRLDVLKGMCESKRGQREQMAQTIDGLIKEEELLDKTEKVLKHLIDKLVTADLNKMDRLITYGLNTVFPDKDLRFSSTIEERGKKIRIALQTVHNGEVVDQASMSSISVIESFLLRVLCIIKLKKAPILLMDETFPAVDSGYIENVSKLLAQLAQKLGIDILLVTHNPGFSESVHSSFKLTSKKNTLEIEKVK